MPRDQDVTGKRGTRGQLRGRIVWRCPDCGDQTIQKRGGTCGLCFALREKIVKLIPTNREYRVIVEPVDDE